MTHSFNPLDWFVGLIASLILTLCGCSGLIPSGTESSVITGNTQAIVGRLASTQPVVDIAANDAALTKEYQAATVNPFACLWGGKSILCNATVYSDLAAIAAYAQDMDVKAAAGRMTLENMADDLQLDAFLQSDISDLMNGQPATTSLVSVQAATAKIQAKAKAKMKATTAPLINVQQLISQLPPQVQQAASAWLAQYGPQLANFALSDIQDILNLLVSGDQQAATRAMLYNMPADQVLANKATLLNKVQADTTKNAADMAAEKQAGYGLIGLVISAAGMIFGF